MNRPAGARWLKYSKKSLAAIVAAGAVMLGSMSSGSAAPSGALAKAVALTLHTGSASPRTAAGAGSPFDASSFAAKAAPTQGGSPTGQSATGVPPATSLQLEAHDGKFWAGSTTVTLRGSSLFCNCDVEKTYSQLASFGMNVIRLPIKWNLLEPNPPVYQGGTWKHTYDQSYMDNIKLQVGWAKKYGLYAIVASYNNLHTFWQYPDWLYTADYNSHGITYPKTDDGIVRAQTDFWSDPLRKQFSMSMFDYMSKQLAPVAGVAGYELLNEPHWGNLPPTHDTTQLMVDWQVAAAQKVRANDPDRIIFFMTRGDADFGLANADLSGYAAMGNVAMDMHDYFGARFGNGLATDPNSAGYQEAHQQVYDNVLGWPGMPYIGNVYSHEQLLRAIRKLLVPWGFPIIIGEFGDLPQDPNFALFLHTGVTAFNNVGISWTVNRPDVVNPDGTLAKYSQIIIDAVKA
jgi:hypothetical protein